MENHNAIHGKTHYKWTCSLAMLNYRTSRVIIIHHHYSSFIADLPNKDGDFPARSRLNYQRVNQIKTHNNFDVSRG